MICKFQSLVLVIISVPMVSGAAPSSSVTEQETVVVKASPLKKSETPVASDAVVLDGENDGSVDGFGYGSGVGIGEGGYGEGSSDYYGTSNYGFTNDQDTSGIVEPIALPERVVPAAPANTGFENTVAAKIPSTEDNRSWKPYISIMGGLVDPSRLENANGKGAIGAGAGVLFSNGIAVEASFLYAYLQTSHSYCRSTSASCGVGDADLQTDNFVDHYGGTVEGKYYIDLGSMLFPSLGVVGSYIFRRHSPKGSPAIRDSRSFDGGVTAGMDFRMSPRVQLGVNWRYMTNLSYDVNGRNNSQAIGLTEISQDTQSGLSQFEQVDYQVWLASLKILF